MTENSFFRRRVVVVVVVIALSAGSRQGNSGQSVTSL